MYVNGDNNKPYAEQLTDVCPDYFLGRFMNKNNWHHAYNLPKAMKKNYIQVMKH